MNKTSANVWMDVWMDVNVNNVCLGVITYVYCMHACMILPEPLAKRWPGVFSVFLSLIK